MSKFVSKRKKAYLEILKDVKKVSFKEGIELLKKGPQAKFDETLNVVFRLGVDPKQADQQIRGTVSLPNGIGKSQTILAIGKNADELLKAGADYAGDESMLEKIQSENWFAFDVIVTTPEMMKSFGRYGKLLGPKGLMPSVKDETVTNNLVQTIQQIKKGKVIYKIDKDKNLHLILGKRSFENDKLEENYDAILDKVKKIKPASSKGEYIKKISISFSSSPSVELTNIK